MISEEVSELPSWERLIVSGIDETAVFAIGLEWRDSQSTVIVTLNFRAARLEFSLLQRDHFERQSSAMPCWNSFASFFGLTKEFDGFMRKSDWIPVVVSKNATSRHFDGKTAYELELSGDCFITLIHDTESPNIYVNYAMPLSSVKKGLRNVLNLAVAMSDPASRPKATLNFQVDSGDLKKYFKKSKSAGMMWTSIQYIGADTDDDDETTSPTPDPFDGGEVADSELSVFPIVSLSKDERLCLQVNMVYAADGSYLEFVSNDPEEWFDWVENVTKRTLNPWEGEAKGRWGWYSRR
jgi:hypothetical protein